MIRLLSEKHPLQQRQVNDVDHLIVIEISLLGLLVVQLLIAGQIFAQHDCIRRGHIAVPVDISAGCMSADCSECNLVNIESALLCIQLQIGFAGRKLQRHLELLPVLPAAGRRNIECPERIAAAGERDLSPPFSDAASSVSSYFIVCGTEIE